MATIRFLGTAAKIAQISNYTLAGTWEANDVIRATIGTKRFDTTAGSTVAATIAQTFVDAWNALSAVQYPEFQEITASRTGDDIILTADEAGKPFTVTLTPLESDLTAADAQTIEGVGVATTGTTTTSSAGPNDWSTAQNWSGSAVPVAADIIYIEDTNIPILYGLDQSAVTVAALYIMATYTGQIGLPERNQAGYWEYRDTFLKIGATILGIGLGPGAGSGRVKINGGTVLSTVTVERTAPTVEPGVPSFCWKGTHASGVMNIQRGHVGVAFFGLEVATVLTMRISHMGNPGGDADVVLGSGCTLTTINQLAGNLLLNAAVTTLTIRGGVCTTRGTGAITTLEVGVLDPDKDKTRSVCYANATGTITTANVRAWGTLDVSQSQAARTITTTTVYRFAALLDTPFRPVTYTNAPALGGGATPSEVNLFGSSGGVGSNA